MTKGEQMLVDLGYVKHMGSPEADDHDLFYFDNTQDCTSIVFSRCCDMDGIYVRSYCQDELTGLYGDELLACAEIVKEIKSYD